MMKSFATKGCVHGMTVQKQRGDMQTRILAYIEQEIKTRGYAPSVREIGEAVGLKSTSTVHGHLIRLEKKGASSSRRHEAPCNGAFLLFAFPG